LIPVKENRGGRPDGEWFVRLSEKDASGKRTRPIFRLGTADEATARRKARALIAHRRATNEAGLSALDVAAQSPRFETYAEAWLRARRVRGVEMVASEDSILKLHILPLLGPMLLGDIRPRHVRLVLESAIERQPTIAKQYLVHIRAVIGRILKQAALDELVGENVATRVEVPDVRRMKRKRVILTNAEFALYQAAKNVDAELQLLGLASRCIGGMRTRDLMAWDWSMLDLDTFRVCLVARTKTGHPQRLEVPEIVAGPLRARWLGAGAPRSGPVFPIRKGKKKGEPRPARNVSFAAELRRDLWRAGVRRHACTRPTDAKPPRAGELCCEAGLLDPLFGEATLTRPVDFHSFRRSFSTALAEAGVPEQRAMHLAGHADGRAHARYVLETEAMMRVPPEVLPVLSVAADPSPPLPTIAALGSGLGSAEPTTSISSSGTRDSNSRPSAWEDSGDAASEPPSTRSENPIASSDGAHTVAVVSRGSARSRAVWEGFGTAPMPPELDDVALALPVEVASWGAMERFLFDLEAGAEDGDAT